MFCTEVVNQHVSELYILIYSSSVSVASIPHIRTLLGASSSLVLPMGMTYQKSQAAGTTYRAHKLACGNANAASGSSYYNNVPTKTQSISASAFAASYNSHRTLNRAYRLAKVRKSDLRLALALCAHPLLDDVSHSSAKSIVISLPHQSMHSETR